MDQILQGFLNKFSNRKNYNQIDSSKKFEYFTLFCVINNEHDNISIDEKNLSTGENAQGIDGIGVIVNNKLCSSVREIEQIIEMNNYLDVKFIFIQSKLSSSFSGQEISSFLDWVYIFFQNNEIPANYTQEMKIFFDMKKIIYDNAMYMKNENPICHLYFCNTGNWNDTEDLNLIIQKHINDFHNLSLFSEVSFFPCDSKKLQQMYRKTANPVEARINFSRKVNLPSIPNVEVAYFGVLPFSEFSKIIMDDEGNIRNVFDDNIRDYLGSDGNKVNDEITQTITIGEPKKFCILNNGVTIVTEKISGVADDLTLKNFQIVNGCQTSNVIYENRNHQNLQDILIPIKLIVTDNLNIRSEIARATNNQTGIKSIDLGALTKFQKELQDYYDSLPMDEYKLYFERRTNQYKNNDQIPLDKIITREIQIKAFASMFLESPHNVAGHYGKLTEELADDLFNENHFPEYYYLCALTYFFVDKFLPTIELNNKRNYSINRFKYYIIMIFRILGLKNLYLKVNNQASMNKACHLLLNILKNKHKREDLILKSVQFLISLDSKVDFTDRKLPERKEMTDVIISNLVSIISNNDFFDDSISDKFKDDSQMVIQPDLW